MPFDGFVLAAVRKELAEKITGCAIDRVYQPTALELILNLRRAGERRRLLLSAHPANARAHLATKAPENPPSPPLFCLVLRKHIEGGRLQKIHQPGLDRILTLEIAARDETGAPSRKQLVCEIMGKHSNIILIDEATGLIIDAIKRYSHAVSRHREVLPGRPYLPPPAQDKRNPLLLREEEFVETILGRPLESPLPDALQACLDGFSKPLAKELVYRAGLPEEMVLDECGEYELKKLWRALQELASPARQEQFQPTLILSQKKYLDFAAFDLTHLSGFTRKKGEMNELAEEFYVYRERSEKLEKERQELLKRVRKEVKRLQKKAAVREEQLATAREADEYRLSGELLMANLHRLEKGLAEAALENFYDPENKPVVIPLDPGLSPVENARAYFKKYNKAKGALQKAEEIGAEIRRELAYLESVETALEQAAALADLLEIREELAEQGYLPEERPKKAAKAPRAPEILTFTSSDGFKILAGRNNRQNDYLTMRLAKDNDLWLHAREIPGAHVIIRAGERPPTPAALREAAAIAAYYSRARQSQNVPVDYTLRKNVHKPRGARPGFVIYKEQRTLVADPDEALVERLKGNRANSRGNNEDNSAKRK
ncbi:MAG: NFACT family protein [Armatimonadetes bacterium]|nr:NFACT family protein [Armatimonadota bacterium]